MDPTFRVVTASLRSKSRNKHSPSAESGEMGQELMFILSSVQKSSSSSQKGLEELLADLQHYKKLRTESITFSSSGKHFSKILFWADGGTLHSPITVVSPEQNLISQATTC